MRNYISIFPKKYGKQIDFPTATRGVYLIQPFTALGSIRRSCADVR